MSDLRIYRYRRWQPYDEFNRRYVFQIFDRIQRTQRIFDHVRRELERRYLMRSMASTDSYQKLVEENTRKMEATTRSIEKLQRGATMVSCLAAFFTGFFASSGSLPTLKASFINISELDPLIEELLFSLMSGFFVLVIFSVFIFLFKGGRKTRKITQRIPANPLGARGLPSRGRGGLFAGSCRRGFLARLLRSRRSWVTCIPRSAPWRTR